MPSPAAKDPAPKAESDGTREIRRSNILLGLLLSMCAAAAAADAVQRADLRVNEAATASEAASACSKMCRMLEFKLNPLDIPV